MSLRGKLLLAQLPLVVALAAVGVMAGLAASSLGRSPRAILQDNYRSVLAAERMKDAVDHIQRSLMEPAPEGATDVAAAVELDRGQFETELRAEEGNITEVGEADAARRARQAWVACQPAIDEQIHLLARRTRDESSWRRLEAAFRPVNAAANEVIAINQDAMVRKSAKTADGARRDVRATALAALLAFLAAWLVTSVAIQRMLRPLWLLTRTIARLGEGDFETQVSVGGDDELSRLAVSVNLMARHLQQYRRNSQGRLVLAERASQAAIDSIPDPVVVFDTEGAVVLANDAAEALLWAGVRPAVRSLSTVAPTLRTAVERVRDHVLSGKGAFIPTGFEEAVRLRSSSGDDRYFLARATTVRSVAGATAGATVTLQDVTTLRLAYELRNDLVATVAHEFRTPLTSLRLATHMCLEAAAGPVTERQADLLHAAREECERLESMVDKLLDLARLQGGRVELDCEAVSPECLVGESLAAQDTVAAERRVTLRSTILPGLPRLLVDRQRVRLIFSNLLTNALRQSPPGSSVSVAALLPPSDGLLRFEVSDSAGGIPPEVQPTLFDRFSQVPNGLSGSAGLGLSIAKDVVEAHGGRIGVESLEGRGTTFWFTLPTLAREETASAPR